MTGPGDSLRVRQFQEVTLTSIDDGGAAPVQHPGATHAIAGVDMAVDQILGGVPIQQGEEGGKALVRPVVFVAIAPGGGVGDHNVHAAGAVKAVAKAANAPLHVSFGVLVGAAGIPGTAAQPQDPQATYADHLILDAGAALWGMGLIAAIVIAVDVEDGSPSHGHQKGEVLRIQVAAGQDEVNAIQSSGPVIVPQV